MTAPRTNSMCARGGTTRAGARPVPRRSAFTLVEAIAAMVVISVIGSVSSGLVYASIRGYRDATASAELQSSANAALDRLATLLRSIPRDTTAGVVAPSISSVTASSIVFDTDWTLSLSGTTLQLAEDGGTARTLLANVSSLAIQCYDESGSALSASLSGTSCRTIRRIQLSITVSSQGMSHTLRTRVFLRATMAGASSS